MGQPPVNLNPVLMRLFLQFSHCQQEWPCHAEGESHVEFYVD